MLDAQTTIDTGQKGKSRCRSLIGPGEVTPCSPNHTMSATAQERTATKFDFVNRLKKFQKLCMFESMSQNIRLYTYFLKFVLLFQLHSEFSICLP
jgi:hypothetical protein